MRYNDSASFGTHLVLVELFLKLLQNHYMLGMLLIHHHQTPYHYNDYTTFLVQM